MLTAKTNPFNGIIVETASLPADPAEFQRLLAASLQAWNRNGNQVVWLDIPIERSLLIPVAVEAGFQFHHSGEDYLTLTHRLKADAFIPPFATHYIGAGGVVINEQRELLVVSELHRRDRSRPYYKLPGGALHPGEHVADAVIREIYEETGVRTTFDALVCFRHWHGYRYGKSDIYFICRLTPLSQTIDIHEEEIEEARWMPVNEYLNSEYVGAFNRRIVRAALESEGVISAAVEGYDKPETHEFFMPPEIETDGDGGIS